MKNIRVEVIATYDKPQDFDDGEAGETQEIFSIPLTEDALDGRSEKSIINLIRAHLDGCSDELVKLSLCWMIIQDSGNRSHIDEATQDKYPAIKQSIYRNGKYAFNSWADEFSFKVDTFREFADYDRVVEELS